jgi:hypothetical protein
MKTALITRGIPWLGMALLGGLMIYKSVGCCPSRITIPSMDNEPPTVTIKASTKKHKGTADAAHGLQWQVAQNDVLSLSVSADDAGGIKDFVVGGSSSVFCGSADGTITTVGTAKFGDLLLHSYHCDGSGGHACSHAEYSGALKVSEILSDCADASSAVISVNAWARDFHGNVIYTRSVNLTYPPDPAPPPPPGPCCCTGGVGPDGDYTATQCENICRHAFDEYRIGCPKGKA